MTEQADAPYLLEVRVHEASRIHDDLNGAVDRAVSHAINKGGYGVLVTQHSYTFYTVALSEEVPYGQIMERRLTEPVDADLN